MLSRMNTMTGLARGKWQAVAAASQQYRGAAPAQTLFANFAFRNFGGK